MCRFRSTDSYRKIGYHFGVSKRTAARIKWRVQGYMLFKVGHSLRLNAEGTETAHDHFENIDVFIVILPQNPLGSLPSHVNNSAMTEEQVCGCTQCCCVL